MDQTINLCRSCGAAIHWVVTPAGKRMPVNAGLVTVVKNESKRIVLITEKGETISDAQPGDKGYVSHFATCPNARRHRKIGKE